MSRTLNSKQKDALIEQIGRNDISSVDDLHIAIYSQIEEMNPNELFYQNANRFIMEERFRRIN